MSLATMLGTVAAVAILSSAWPDTALAGDGVYRHRDANGVVAFSDHPSGGNGNLRTSYRSEYGRPTATASCTGLGTSALDRLGETRRPAIEAAAVRHGVPADLMMALVRVESCFDARARSIAGAEGLTQLMPATAAALGVFDRLEPGANLDGGARYLARMLDRFADESLALAAYNAGPGNVDRHGGIPPFPETIRYVGRVQAARDRYRSRRGGGHEAAPSMVADGD